MCAFSVAQSCLTLHKPMDSTCQFLWPWDYPGKNDRVSCHFLPGVFSNLRIKPTSSLHLWHWQVNFYY